MFNIGDYVLNQKTGHLGKVIGYGHQIMNNVYTTTLKVLVAEARNSQKKELVVEDVVSEWTQGSPA
ncbi:hypothetical protein [Nostoc sp. 106C]|jgi:hypothetical protein|uniref:hypothetical protein n=1 Tax=Nostoc sp. 106C TaxID=1932667 RepID=UPI000A365354|nr:hypothetical protein [Nostoc sp. 106C]OUL26216.1 hypothetical protein BV378_13440 [Nostoc sp. RF31YmG]OUL31615.1 hypothetical protein BV375_11680 [Nostoc sp. 106C]